MHHRRSENAWVLSAGGLTETPGPPRSQGGRLAMALRPVAARPVCFTAVIPVQSGCLYGDHVAIPLQLIEMSTQCPRLPGTLQCRAAHLAAPAGRDPGQAERRSLL